MFPTANSTIYRNSDGEVTGWDTPIYDDMHEEYYPEYRLEDEPDFFDTVEECRANGRHGDDGDGAEGTGPNGEDVFECTRCWGRYYHPNGDYSLPVADFEASTDNDEEVAANASSREADLDSLD